MKDRIYAMPSDLCISYASPTHSSLMHRHVLDEMIIMDSGGSQVIANSSVYHIEAPCVIFYPRYQPHQQIHTPDAVYSRYGIGYDTALIEDIVPPDVIPRTFFAIPLEESELAALKPYLELMLRISETEWSADFRHMLAIVLHRLAPLWRMRFAAESGRHITGDRSIYEICHYINEHYAEPLSLEGIAKHFFMSRAKLVRIFRSLLNLSPNQYITNVRLSEARARLRYGASVKDAAFASGFGSVSYFIKVFRRYTGMTPEEFKKKRQPDMP
ncbi:MAG: helix-turn-helix transcriptional regulator [Clostridia bacterium]|nr:helix-turn-helix transcriptional regulator [Clostridia bacterium]